MASQPPPTPTHTSKAIVVAGTSATQANITFSALNQLPTGSAGSRIVVLVPVNAAGMPSPGQGITLTTRTQPNGHICGATSKPTISRPIVVPILSKLPISTNVTQAGINTSGVTQQIFFKSPSLPAVSNYVTISSSSHVSRPATITYQATTPVPKPAPPVKMPATPRITKTTKVVTVKLAKPPKPPKLPKTPKSPKSPRSPKVVKLPTKIVASKQAIVTVPVVIPKEEIKIEVEPMTTAQPTKKTPDFPKSKKVPIYPGYVKPCSDINLNLTPQEISLARRYKLAMLTNSAQPRPPVKRRPVEHRIIRQPPPPPPQPTPPPKPTIRLSSRSRSSNKQPARQLVQQETQTILQMPDKVPSYTRSVNYYMKQIYGDF